LSFNWEAFAHSINQSVAQPIAGHLMKQYQDKIEEERSLRMAEKNRAAEEPYKIAAEKRNVESNITLENVRDELARKRDVINRQAALDLERQNEQHKIDMASTANNPYLLNMAQSDNPVDKIIGISSIKTISDLSEGKPLTPAHQKVLSLLPPQMSMSISELIQKGEDKRQKDEQFAATMKQHEVMNKLYDAETTRVGMDIEKIRNGATPTLEDFTQMTGARQRLDADEKALLADPTYSQMDKLIGAAYAGAAGNPAELQKRVAKIQKDYPSEFAKYSNTEDSLKRLRNLSGMYEQVMAAQFKQLGPKIGGAAPPPGAPKEIPDKTGPAAVAPPADREINNTRNWKVRGDVEPLPGDIKSSAVDLERVTPEVAQEFGIKQGAPIVNIQDVSEERLSSLAKEMRPGQYLRIGEDLYRATTGGVQIGIPGTGASIGFVQVSRRGEKKHANSWMDRKAGIPGW
jgi:hypothetical protein